MDNYKLQQKEIINKLKKKTKVWNKQEKYTNKKNTYKDDKAQFKRK